MDYLFHIVIIIGIYVILSLSANLLIGMANLLSLGQAAFYALGAYIGAFALIKLNLTIIPATMLVMTVAVAGSLLVSVPSMKLRGDYFVLVTMGFHLITYSILNNWVAVTRGPYGIAGIPPLRLFGDLTVNGLGPFMLVSTSTAAVAGWAFYLLDKSPFGRNLRGIRDDELAVKSLGRNPATVRMMAFAVSSAFSAFAGLLYATYVSYIDPSSFTLDESIFILSAVLIGGSGNIKGPIAGVVFVVMLPELLRFVGLPNDLAANLRMILYGVALILLMRFRPQGIFGSFVVR